MSPQKLCLLSFTYSRTSRNLGYSFCLANGSKEALSGGSPPCTRPPRPASHLFGHPIARVASPRPVRRRSTIVGLSPDPIWIRTKQPPLGEPARQLRLHDLLFIP